MYLPAEYPIKDFTLWIGLSSLFPFSTHIGMEKLMLLNNWDNDLRLEQTSQSNGYLIKSGSHLENEAKRQISQLLISVFNSIDSRRLSSSSVSFNCGCCKDSSCEQLYSNNLCQMICVKYSYLIVRAIKSFRTILFKSDLNDLVQEGFLVLCESAKSLDIDDFEDFNKTISMKIEARLKKLRRKQLSYNSVSKLLISESLETTQFIPRIEDETSEIKFIILQGIQCLSVKQRELLYRLYGFYGEPSTIKDIAEESRVSHESIRRLHKRALSNLALNPEIQMLAA